LLLNGAAASTIDFGIVITGGSAMKTPRYIDYTDFGANLGMSYPEYRQKREFSDAIQISIAEGAASIVAASRETTAEVTALSSVTRDGFANVQISLDAVRSEVGSAVYAIQAGFAATVFELRRANETLSSLLEVARTPAETWALEQFGAADEAYRRRLFPEALEALRRAIDGYGSNVGYRMNYRFHLLEGGIRLGEDSDVPAELVDLAKAEECFLSAARYARHDDRTALAQSLLLAGRAAHLQADYARAEKHLRESLDVQPSADAHYGLAKTLAAQHRDGEALQALEATIRLLTGFALIMFGDPDLEHLRSRMVTLVQCLSAYCTRLCNEASNIVATRCEWLDKIYFDPPQTEPISLGNACQSELRELLTYAAHPSSQELAALVGYLEASAEHVDALHTALIAQWKRSRLDLLRVAQEAQKRDFAAREQEARAEHSDGNGIAAGVGAGIVTAFVLSLVNLSVLAIPAGVAVGFGVAKATASDSQTTAADRLADLQIQSAQDADLMRSLAETIFQESDGSIEPAPASFLAAWRDGELQCSNRPELQSPSRESGAS